MLSKVRGYRLREHGTMGVNLYHGYRKLYYGYRKANNFGISSLFL